MPSASSGVITSYSTVRVFESASTSSAADAAEREVVPRLPRGAVRVDAEVLHERGERLVEPDAVPPLHRHEVAEPHVRDLVHDRERGVGHLAERHLLGIEEQARLAERHAAEVLHRAEREVGERDEVALLAGVRDPVVVGEELDRERADVERERGEVRLARHVRDAHRDAARVDRVGELERADHPRDEVRRHRDRRRRTCTRTRPSPSDSRADLRDRSRSRAARRRRRA